MPERNGGYPGSMHPQIIQPQGGCGHAVTAAAHGRNTFGVGISIGRASRVGSVKLRQPWALIRKPVGLDSWDGDGFPVVGRRQILDGSGSCMDCGSLLPLSPRQPCCQGATRGFIHPQATNAAGRAAGLHGPKLQEPVAVQGGCASFAGAALPTAFSCTREHAKPSN